MVEHDIQVRSKQRESNANLWCDAYDPLVNDPGAKTVQIVQTGAKGVAWCFSAASMSTESTNAVVINISMKTPWARLIPGCRKVLRIEVVSRL